MDAATRRLANFPRAPAAMLLAPTLPLLAYGDALR